MKKLYNALYIFMFSALLFIIVVFPSILNGYVKSSLKLSFDHIIPALFPFILLGQILTKSGASYKMGIIISPILYKVFGVPRNLAGAFITGLFCGFPTGAIAVGEAYKKGLCTKAQGEYCCAICNNCSFPFVISYMGMFALGSLKNGLILIVSQVITIIISSAILRFAYVAKSSVKIQSSISQQTNESISNIICTSITDTVKAVLNICGFVSAFNIFSCLITDKLKMNNILSAIIKGTMEISGGGEKIIDIEFPENFIITSFILGFSGLSVIFQVTDITEKYGYSSSLFFINRVISSIIMPIVCSFLLVLLPPQAISVFNPFTSEFSHQSTYTTATFILYAIFFLSTLILLGLLLILSSIIYNRKKHKDDKNNKMYCN